MQMKNFLLLLVLVLSGVSYGQTCRVKGVFIDSARTRLSGVTVRSPQAPEQFIISNSRGEFVIEVPCIKAVQLYFKMIERGVSDQQVVQLNGNEVTDLGEIPLNIATQELDGVDVRGQREELFELDPLNLADMQTLPLGGVERFLLFTTAATSNNELTSNYNVRGGNYDENLVYVNGFQIYRPFLTRSGQQEGMSFVNTALVEEVSFRQVGLMQNTATS